MNCVRLAKFIQFGLKSVIFITLLIVCYVFLMMEAIEKSSRAATTISERSVDLGYEYPDVVICSYPDFKPSVSEVYGVKYPTRDLFNMKTSFTEKYKHVFDNKTIRSVFQSFSYADDLEFWALGYPLKEGSNEIKIADTIVDVGLKTIRTTYNGVCHVIQARGEKNSDDPGLAAQYERFGTISIKYKKTLDISDIPKSFILYFVARDEWQGKLTISFKFNYH